MSSESKTLEEIAQNEASGKKDSNLKMTLRRLVHNRLALVGGIIFILLCLMAVFAPVIAPYHYSTIDLAPKFSAPSLQHLFGTDQYGRDIFSRVVYGSRWSISMGLSAAVVSLVGGTTIGILAGYCGGWIDTLVMRIIDIIQCIPNILLTICIATALGNTFFNTVIAMSFSGMWGIVRLVRSQSIHVRMQQYVEAATATNNPPPRIMLRHILPNAIQPAIINTCMGIGATISLAASLSFIGLGIQPPLPEWGAMLNDGREVMRYHPFVLAAPGIMIMLTVLSIGLLGDGLRDAMDPRMKT